MELAGVFVCPFEMPCPSPAPAMPAPGLPYDLDIGGTKATLAWGDPSGVYTCVLPEGSDGGGCDPAAASAISDAGFARAVRADSAYVYWVDSPFNGGGGPLYRCPLSGCAGAPEVVAPSVSTVLAMDTTAIYWSSGTGITMLVK